MATIHTIEELAAQIGANRPTEASMSRRIFKDTECGAWLKFYTGERVTLRSPVTWDIDFADSTHGVVCLAGKKSTDDYIVSPQDFPHELKQFLSLSVDDNGRHLVCVDDPDILCVSDIPETDRVHRLDGTNTWRVQFDVWHVAEPGDEVLGVQIGSIVEGADEETSVYTLLFPFEMSAFEDSLQGVEEEAEEIWDRWH